MVEVSRHKCLIYEGHPSEQLPVILPMMIQSLREKQRCIYLGDPEMVQLVQEGLYKKGVNLQEESTRGALLFSSDRDHLKTGHFNPEAMVVMLCQLIDKALSDGFAGLYATGDMRWELGDDKNFDRLREYEARLDLVFRDKPLAGVCQYHRDTVPVHAIQDALMTHESIYVGHHLNQNNFFYIPPDLLLGEGGDGKDRMAQWMWQQVTRIVQAEAQRDKTLRALEEMNRTLEQRVHERTADLEAFSYSISHDLRAPLRAIGGFSRLIMESNAKNLDPKGQEFFGHILSSTKRMSELIEALLELFHLSQCRVESHEVNLSKQAQLILEELQKSDPNRIVEWNIQPNLEVVGDHRLLTSALQNLLGNAWKFTAKVPKAVIEFGMVEKEGERVFFVRDNGAGFNMDCKDKLFKPFQRLHSLSDYAGSGVGLASVQKILSQHSGRIWAEATVGKGATFYFTLPDRPLSDA